MTTTQDKLASQVQALRRIKPSDASSDECWRWNTECVSLDDVLRLIAAHDAEKAGAHGDGLLPCPFCGRSDSTHTPECYFTIEESGGDVFAAWNRRATAPLLAPEGMVLVPDGWKLVPYGTTWDMRNEARELMLDLGVDGGRLNLDRLAHGIWDKMVTAAPAPPPTVAAQQEKS